MRMANARIHPRETLLRRCIVTTAACAPIATGASLAPHILIVPVIATVFIVLGGIAGGFTVLFYALWCLGWLVEGSDPGYGARSELIGDDTLYCPPPYWPWSKRVAALRTKRRIIALERANGVLLGEGWYDI